MLDVGDGNLLYWETCGNPDGRPAVVLDARLAIVEGAGHGGGPGMQEPLIAATDRFARR
jgi:proline iminopeptidase